MKGGMRIKLVFILFLIAFSVLLILPTVGEKKLEITFRSDATQEQIESIKSQFPDESFIIEKKSDTKIIIKGYKLSSAKMNEINQAGKFIKSAKLLKHWAENYFMAKKINLGLDLQGGMQVVLQADYEKMEKKSGKKFDDAQKKEITAQALEIISNRINTFGVSEPSIRPKGVEAIEIQLPGVRNPEDVKKAFKQTGRVEYRLVDNKYTLDVAKVLKEKNIKIPINSAEQQDLINELAAAVKLPDTMEILFHYNRDKKTDKIFPDSPMVVLNEVALAGDDIALATVGKDEYGFPAVDFQTTDKGTAKFAKVTAPKNRDKRMAIIIDDKVRSAPAINGQITGGRAQITGSFNFQEVNVLARIIKEGALPVDLKIIEERTVGPSLGGDSIAAGIKAILFGLGCIILFMLVYYKLAGLVANFSLLLNMVFMLALLSWLGFTLTLPGIAGFILTVGMAVDANVIIYERIKEEQRNGKSARTAVVNGYERAFWTIFDANLTTLIAAIILAQFGTGPIKGFAVTLVIGIICSMFVALYVSRFIYEVITQNKKIKKLSI